MGNQQPHYQWHHKAGGRADPGRCDTTFLQSSELQGYTGDQRCFGWHQQHAEDGR